MEGIQNKIRKCSFVTLFLVFSFLFGATNMRVASFPNEDISSTAFEADNEELYGSKESCQELRERVESLEEAVRAIVSTLSDESLQHFTAVIEKSSKNRGVQSVLSAPISTSEDVQEEENSPTETPYSSRPAKPSISKFITIFDEWMTFLLLYAPLLLYRLSNEPVIIDFKLRSSS